MEEDLFDAKTCAKILGENLKRIRKERGITREKLSKDMGLAVTAIGQYERAERLPSLEKIFELAALLRVSITDLTGENPNRVPLSPLDVNQVFEYRFRKARHIAEDIFDFPSPIIGTNGNITVLAPTWTKFQDDTISFSGSYTPITFKDAESFVNVMEQAESLALKKSFNESFREIVQKKKT